MDGLVFGMVDNGVLILGAYAGCDIGEKLGRSALGAIIGAGIGNTVSDIIGACLDPAMQHMIGGIGLGCLIPLLAVPLVERWKEARNG